ncbi:MAG TPA: hypothetical protein VFS14_03315, partial [Candidatus Saccharimonadales bacterium]|nr:hypothetical protein [Candidatus Saccharimonadales bacterium]
DFIGELASEDALFVTADGRFIEDVVNQDIKHAGIVLVPVSWDDKTLEFAAAGLAGILRGAIESDGRRHLHNQIYIISDDGYYLVEKGKKRLLCSIDKFQLTLEEYIARNER